MRKWFLTGILSFITVFSAFGTGCGKKDVNALIWTGYEETVEAYISDIYYCSFPSVQDTLGNTYEVFATVKDETGQEVDSLGGFFLVEKEEYQITYSVDDGVNTHSKITTLSAIEKAKYALTDASNVIYSVNERIDLSGLVHATAEGDISYAVKKGNEEFSVDGDTFTPTQVGVYTVEAKMEKQPSFSFEIYVVEATSRRYADGLILDGVSAQDIRVDNSYNDYTATVSFDETKKYDSASNGSYKIEAKTEGKLENTRTLGFCLSPAYNEEYYQKLESDGYEYIAMRYMLEENETSGTGRLIYADGAQNGKVAMYYNEQNVKYLEEATSIWNTDFDRVPTGEWAEILLDIKTFTSSYAGEELPLFKLRVNGKSETAEGSSWDLTMYIDNIYAVKAREEAIQVVDKGAQIDLSSMEVEGVYFNGKEISVADNKLSVNEYGLYEIVGIDRTVYGKKQSFMATGTNTVVPFETENFSAKHGNTASSKATFDVEKTNNQIAITADSSVWTTNTWQRVAYTVKPLNSKIYYTTLQELGYEYITYEYTLDFGDTTYAYSTSPSMYRVALTRGTLTHYNDLKPIAYNDDGTLKEGNTATHQFKCVQDNATGNTAEKPSGNKSFWATTSPDDWNKKTFIVSISIQDFISLYNSGGMNMLTLYFSHAQTFAYSVTFSKMQATTQACVFEA